jgi:hypothetical protein
MAISFLFHYLFVIGTVEGSEVFVSNPFSLALKNVWQYQRTRAESATTACAFKQSICT